MGDFIWETKLEVYDYKRVSVFRYQNQNKNW